MDIKIISASAGSGKTYRLAGFLEEEVKAGTVRPDAILATTFTKKAAAELQERVRTRLLTAGLSTEAQQLSASRIGTVNSVCGALLTDFAFDLGISPSQKVLEEDAVSGVINRAMARVIDKAANKEIWRLEQCFPGTEPRKTIETIIAKARANGLDSKELLQCGKRSATEFLELLGKEADDGDLLDQDLCRSMDSFLQKLDIEYDTTIDTGKAAAIVRRLRNTFNHQKKIPWCDWLRLAKLKTGAKSREIVEPLHIAAACHDNHPQFRQDASLLITFVFEAAAKTLDAYQEYKREWGVVDFTDQEALTLQLLDMKQPAKILQERLDLVLVDEFQDTSPIQLAIFLKLASLARKSVWVGDQKQAIYGFRDADPALMDAAIQGILKDEEPETLKYSWRSRPELVRSSSDIFVQAFANYDFPEQRVRLEPAIEMEKKIPQGLSPVYECWQLESKNIPDDSLALASSVCDLLADSASTIRDSKTGEKRQARGGDVAILCRTNDVCLDVARALEEQGIEAALPRSGLLDCPEVILTLAGMRLLIDSRDSLARAEIARLLDDPQDHNGFLEKALRKPYTQGFTLEMYGQLEQAKESIGMEGPLQVLDTAMKVTDVRKHCLAWGDSNARLANLDSLRTLCVGYIEECRSSGRGASSAGMFSYLDELEADTKAVVKSENTVQVLTWHKSKGLEWPVIVLYQLNKVFPALPLGVNAVSDTEFCLEAPLADRWLRYWPNPYGKLKGAEFHERLVGHSATFAHAEKEERQELRLLYVGWTRARDKVVLAGRKGFLTKGILRLLVDEQGEHLLSIPEEQKAVWAGREMDVVTRSNGPSLPVTKSVQAGTGYKPGAEKEYPPAFQSASSVVGEGIVAAMEDIGDRLPLTGKVDMQALGEAIHTFLGADDYSQENKKRLNMADEILQRWKVAANFNAETLVAASDRLRIWIDKNWPDALWHREYPVALQQDDGMIVSGFIDLLLETPKGFVVIDHKSFPGSADASRSKAIKFTGQLSVYAEAVGKATGKEVTELYIHLPVGGMVLQIKKP